MSLNHLEGNPNWYKYVFPHNSSILTPALLSSLKLASNPFDLNVTVSDITKISRHVDLYHAGYENSPLFRLAYSLAFHSRHSLSRKIQLILALPPSYIPTNFVNQSSFFVLTKNFGLSFLDEHIEKYVLWLAGNASITAANKAIKYALSSSPNPTLLLKILTPVLHNNSKITSASWSAYISLKSTTHQVEQFPLFVGLDKTGKHSWEVAKSLHQHTAQPTYRAGLYQAYKILEDEAVRLVRVLLEEDLTQAQKFPNAWYVKMINTVA